MKKTLKTISIIIAVLLLLIVILSVTAKLKENEIAAIALRKIGESINAPLVVDDVSLNLIRRFPFATIELEGVLLGSQNAFGLSDSLITRDETLAKIEKVYISVKTRPLFKGKFEIRRVEIRGVAVDYIVDKQGVSNFDFLLPVKEKDTTDTASVGLSVMLKELVLRNINVSYYDSLNLIVAQLEIPKAEISGEVKGDYLEGIATGSMILTNPTFKTNELLLPDKTEFEFNVAYSNGNIDLHEFIVTFAGAELLIDGTVVLKDTIETDIHLRGDEIDLSELVRYAPAELLKNTQLKKISGIMTLEASVQGAVADSLLPEVILDVELEDGTLQFAGHPAVKNFSFTGNITNGKQRNNQTTRVTLSKLHAETGGSSIDLSAALNNLDRMQYQMETDISIDPADINHYVSDTIMTGTSGRLTAAFNAEGFLPDSIGKDFIDNLLETSKLDLKFQDLSLVLYPELSIESISGQLLYDIHHITARDLQLKIPSYKLNFHNTSFAAHVSGKFSEPTRLGIELKSFEVRTDSSVLYGSAKIRDLLAPDFDITGSFKLNLGEIDQILPDTLVNSMSGEITAHITSHGKLDPDSVSNQLTNLVFNNSTFKLDFDRVSVNMPDTLMCVKDFSGNLQMKPDTIRLDNIRGKYQGIDFGIDSTVITNLYPSVIENKTVQLKVDGRFNLGDLDYSLLAALQGNKADTNAVSGNDQEIPSAEQDNKGNLKNYTYSVKGKLRVKSFTYTNAVAENISCLFNISDSLYLVDQFKFNAFGGIHTTSVRYAIKQEERNLWIKNKVEGMDINRLLRDFDNFKAFYEPAITHENISGLFSANVDGQILFKGDSLVRDKLYVRGEIKLEKGGIYNYAPVMDMEQYLKTIGSLDKLEFKTINSNVFIFQDDIYVPTTLVVSNKLDASALGMKSFGEDYSYHFIVYLSDLLTGKSQNRIEKQDRQGEEITSAGRKGTMVRSYSIDGKRRSGFDNQKDQNEMKRKIMASERLLNVRFHPHLVNYNTGVN